MKKFLIVSFLFVSSVFLVGCGSDKGKKINEEDSSSEISAVSENREKSESNKILESIKNEKIKEASQGIVDNYETYIKTIAIVDCKDEKIWPNIYDLVTRETAKSEEECKKLKKSFVENTLLLIDYTVSIFVRVDEKLTDIQASEGAPGNKEKEAEQSSQALFQVLDCRKNSDASYLLNEFIKENPTKEQVKSCNTKLEEARKVIAKIKETADTEKK